MKRKIWFSIGGTILFIIVFILISYTNFFGLGHTIWHSRLFSHLFVDKDGKFVWLGITSVLAIATLTFNAWDRRRQFRADLISKSRIVWIENVRQTTGSLIGAMETIDMKLRQLKVSIREDAHSDTNSRAYKAPLFDYGESLNHLENVAETLKMYFNSKDSDGRNADILEMIDLVEADAKSMTTNLLEVSKEAEKAKEEKDYKKLNSMLHEVKYEKLHKLVKKIRADISDYLKIEWEKAKHGK